MDPQKLEAILAYLAPTTVRQLRGFLGAAKHYSRYIKDMAHLILPLNTLLRVEKKFVWDEPQTSSFSSFKKVFTTAPVLKSPDASKPFHLFSACSQHVISACVAQLSEKKLHPIAYYSRKLKDAKSRYTWVEIACLAIAEGAKNFRTYLTMQHTIIYVSKDSLRFMMNKLEPPEHIMRWIVELQLFEYELKSKPPALQNLVDCLADVPPCADEIENVTHDLFHIELFREWYDQIASYLSTLEFPLEMNKAEKKPLVTHAQKFSIIEGEFYQKGFEGLYRRCVHKEEIPHILKEYHDSACGPGDILLED
ncbi:hypothetical protein L7F22_038036 [Adiantum nelumboides]|nr:hypothetical protein [Adiantum nelumboides]